MLWKEREKSGKISRTKLHLFFILPVQFSVVVFARCIPPLLASKPVSFLLCFPSLYFCDKRDRREQAQISTGQSDIKWTTDSIYSYTWNCIEEDRSRWYLEMTLEVVQGEPFHSHQPQHRFGRRFCRRTAQSNGKRCQSLRKRSCIVITTRSPDQWIC